MRVCYQFALGNSLPWQQVDSSAWASLPQRPVPLPGQAGAVDNLPGYIANVNIQGLTCEGYDHVAVEEVVIGLDEGVRLTVWNDDPVDYTPDEFHAIVWTILPLAADPALGMAINTRQSCIWYCGGARFTRLAGAPPQNTAVRPWAEFVPPPAAATRHGIWLTDQKWAEHVAAAPQAAWSWRHWVDHLPDDEIELDQRGRRFLKAQRPQGRYRPSEHTMTWYQKITDLLVGYVAATNEDALENTAGANETETVTMNATNVDAWTFTTASNVPNSPDWPNGTVRCQLDCTAASLGVLYGVLVLTGTGGNFRRIDSTTNTSLEATAQSEVVFSGTGLKLATKSFDFAAGSASDRFTCHVAAGGDSHGDAMTLRFSADAWADGPWGPTDTVLPGAGDFSDLHAAMPAVLARC